MDRFTIVDVTDGQKKEVKWVKVDDRRQGGAVAVWSFFMNLSHACIIKHKLEDKIDKSRPDSVNEL